MTAPLPMPLTEQTRAVMAAKLLWGATGWAQRRDDGKYVVGYLHVTDEGFLPMGMGAGDSYEEALANAKANHPERCKM